MAYFWAYSLHYGGSGLFSNCAVTVTNFSYVGHICGVINIDLAKSLQEFITSYKDSFRDWKKGVFSVCQSVIQTGKSVARSVI